MSRPVRAAHIGEVHRFRSSSKARAGDRLVVILEKSPPSRGRGVGVTDDHAYAVRLLSLPHEAVDQLVGKSVIRDTSQKRIERSGDLVVPMVGLEIEKFGAHILAKRRPWIFAGLVLTDDETGVIGSFMREYEKAVETLVRHPRLRGSDEIRIRRQAGVRSNPRNHLEEPAVASHRSELPPAGTFSFPTSSSIIAFDAVTSAGGLAAKITSA